MKIRMIRSKQHAQQHKMWLDWLDDDTSSSKQPREHGRGVYRTQRTADYVYRQVGRRSQRAVYGANRSRVQTAKITDPDNTKPTALPISQSVQIGTSKKRAIIARLTPARHVMVAAVCASLFGVSLYWYAGHDAKNLATKQDTTSQYAYVTSTNNVEMHYDPDKRVASYVDRIGGTEITVSQQSIPPELTTREQSAIEQFAAKMGMKEVIATANPTAYMGAFANGQQTVLFIKKDVMVLMRAKTPLDSHDWASYITSLQ